jgi:hypothetical protein
MLTTSVMGIAKSHAQAQGALDALLSGGFVTADFSVLFEPPPGAVLECEVFDVVVGVRTLALPDGRSVCAAGPLRGALEGLGAQGLQPNDGARALPFALEAVGLSRGRATQVASSLEGGAVLLVVHCDAMREQRRAHALFGRAGLHTFALPVREQRWFDAQLPLEGAVP